MCYVQKRKQQTRSAAGGLHQEDTSWHSEFEEKGEKKGETMMKQTMTVEDQEVETPE